MARKRDKSTQGLRDFMRDVAPVWNKQCTRCGVVYSKFHRLCPDCSYGEWLLEGEVDDTEAPPRKSGQKPHYRPREETIRNECLKIQEQWKKDGDVRATLGPVRWKPPGSSLKQRDDDHDRF